MSLFTSVAIIAFALALLVLSMFSYIPWWASGLLITAFFVVVACALRPWNPMERNTMLWVMVRDHLILGLSGSVFLSLLPPAQGSPPSPNPLDLS